MDAGLSRPPTEMETRVKVFVFYFLPCKDRRPAEDTPAEGAGPLFLLLEILHFFCFTGPEIISFAARIFFYLI